MNIEEIKLIKEKVHEIEKKHEQLEDLSKFINELTKSKQLTLSEKSLTLYFGKPSIYEFIGKELIQLLELKKTDLEEEIHNFTLDQLLPKDEIENSELGIKFKYKDDKSTVDDGTYYYKIIDKNAVISWLENGVLFTNKSFSIYECETLLKDETWIKL